MSSINQVIPNRNPFSFGVESCFIHVFRPAGMPHLQRVPHDIVVARDGAGAESHADDFEYVMYGKVFKHHQKAGEHLMAGFISFGGLLMHLHGDETNLNKLALDTRIYLLMRKS